MPYLIRIAVVCAALAAPFTHAAQTPETRSPAPAQATDSAARVPDTRYDSAFTGYQPYRDQKLAPWRELNDEVHKARGHIGIVGGAAGKPAAHPPGHKK